LGRKFCNNTYIGQIVEEKERKIIIQMFSLNLDSTFTMLVRQGTVNVLNLALGEQTVLQERN
jgi:hypothetical protein